MINWEEFGRSQLARTVLNLSQLGRREASDLAFHRKAVARKMTDPIHTEEVTGSIPVSPTRSEAIWISIKLTMGAIPVAAKCAAISPRSWTHPSARKAAGRDAVLPAPGPPGQQVRGFAAAGSYSM
jgi:hypothetical protein